MRRPIALVLLVVLTSCGSTPTTSPSGAATRSPSPSNQPVDTLTGTFVLSQDATVDRQFTGGELISCAGTGGFDDITTGAPVVIRDGSGDVLATGRLTHDGVVADINATRSCTYTFAIDVPPSDFYSVEVTHRGELTYSREELEEMGWQIEASLGQ